MNYFIHTYGCQMNIHESEKIAGILKDKGFLPTAEEKDADIIVFNTCCIREKAEQHALGNIGAVKHFKRKNPELIVVVCGCMPQQDGAAERLTEKFPYIDIVIGTHNLASLGDKLDRLHAIKSRVVDTCDEDCPEPKNAPIFRTSGKNAWVNIMYGCDNFCTYCIVPYVRGRERSRSADDICAEVTQLMQTGEFSEITLLGQNVNSYGGGADESGQNFPDLLRKINAIEGEFRIKFMTSHPKDFGAKLVDALAECEKAAKIIHLPVQSGSTRILKEMNRRYTREQYLDKIKMLRARIPGVALSSDVMVGFPGETDDDFLQTLGLVEEVRYDNLFMFVYSRRSGTVADKMPDQVDAAVKNKRIRKLVETQREIETSIAAESVGKCFRALTEWKSGVLTASTDNGKFVTLDGGSIDDDGKFVRIKITSHRASKLYGELADR